ncbi:MAG TPA: hypothetical protein VM536_23555, partial [Chloroflexia bacterium]|nr:hypothetical protein [Chloroflexia bacterium]
EQVRLVAPVETGTPSVLGPLQALDADTKRAWTTYGNGQDLPGRCPQGVQNTVYPGLPRQLATRLGCPVDPAQSYGLAGGLRGPVRLHESGELLGDEASGTVYTLDLTDHTWDSFTAEGGVQQPPTLDPQLVFRIGDPRAECTTATWTIQRFAAGTIIGPRGQESCQLPSRNAVVLWEDGTWETLAPLTATPRATTVPTRTPRPPATATPTHTPRPSATTIRTRTPRPSATATRTRTPRPSVTPTRTALPTRTPRPSATPTFTRTPRPSTTPTRTPRPRIQLPVCATTPVRGFGRVWTAVPGVAARLGCPVTSEQLVPKAPGDQASTAIEPFERGRMFFVAATDQAPYPGRSIFTLLANGTYKWAADAYVEGAPPACSPKPPANRFVPVRGFNKVWCADQQTLGWALAPEQGGDGAWQRFDNGVLYWTGGTNEIVGLFPRERTWEIIRDTVDP